VQHDSFEDRPQVEVRPAQLDGFTHAPPTHVIPAEHATWLPHAVPHALVRLRFVSQPLLPPTQSPNPVVQPLIPQTPAVQDAVPLAVEHATRFPQVIPHAVTWFRLVSQPLLTWPSQFPYPELQLAIPHAPAVQDAVPFAAEHTTPAPQVVLHAVGRFRLVSQPLLTWPSQFPYPELQLAIPQVPLVHDGAPFVTAQATRFPQVVPHAATWFRFVSQPVATCPSHSP
jgi:hypothetical protein